MVTTAIEEDAIELPETWLDDDPDYDPYAVFDAQVGAGQESPYPLYREIRDRGGVLRLKPRTPLDDVASDDDGPPPQFEEWRPGDPEEPLSYGVFTHEAVTEALRNWQVFSSTGYAETMGLVFGHSILEMDPPEHTSHRSLVAQAFRPKVLERWESELVRPVIQEQIDTFKGDGEADLTLQFNLVYPVKVIAGILGVPLAHWDWFRRRAIEEITIASNIERGLEASRALGEYFRQIITYRRRNPGHDLISELVQAEIDGHRLDDEEIIPFLMLLSPAGAETTYRSTGNLLYGLFTNPAQFEALKADRDLMPHAIEEAIRWEPPLTAIQRKTMQDTEMNGVAIPEGASVLVNMGSANHDQAVFGDDAEEFNIFRERHHHLAFAHGPHMCLGMHLARLEMKLAINMLFDQLPDLHLDPATADETCIDGQGFRSPNQLRVRFTPVR